MPLSTDFKSRKCQKLHLKTFFVGATNKNTIWLTFVKSSLVFAVKYFLAQMISIPLHTCHCFVSKNCCFMTIVNEFQSNYRKHLVVFYSKRRVLCSADSAIKHSLWASIRERKHISGQHLETTLKLNKLHVLSQNNCPKRKKIDHNRSWCQFCWLLETRWTSD